MNDCQRYRLFYSGVEYEGNKNWIFIIIIDWLGCIGLVDEVEKTKIDGLVLATTNFDRRWKDENLVIMNMSSYGAMDFAPKIYIKINMQTWAHELSKLIKQRYVPTSLEERGPVMMYLFVWIIIGLETKQISLHMRCFTLNNHFDGGHCSLCFW